MTVHRTLGLQTVMDGPEPPHRASRGVTQLCPRLPVKAEWNWWERTCGAKCSDAAPCKHEAGLTDTSQNPCHRSVTCLVRSRCENLIKIGQIFPHEAYFLLPDGGAVTKYGRINDIWAWQWPYVWILGLIWLRATELHPWRESLPA